MPPPHLIRFRLLSGVPGREVGGKVCGPKSSGGKGDLAIAGTQSPVLAPENAVSLAVPPAGPLPMAWVEVSRGDVTHPPVVVGADGGWAIAAATAFAPPDGDPDRSRVVVSTLRGSGAGRSSHEPGTATA